MNTQEQEYDFLPYVFTEKMYYIDAVKSEWEIESNPAEENKTNQIGKNQEPKTQLESKTLKQEINKIKTDNSESQSNNVLDADFSYFGKNRKNFLILTRETEQENIKEADNKLLTSILAAGQLSLNDVAIVNMSKTKATFLDLYKKLKPTSVVSFGVDTKKLGVPHEFETYKPIKIKAITWIISHNFVALHSDKTKKLGLWTALKELECYVS
ncbi:hypothetical protein Fleli_0052 [Bernardetia litoralis DSM 6794]|uniref:Uncharacterized protein n=1 Tax=Bernardetia litoralis (strain ATCC 23117 / DSM 6794 / NBRC 15988 / NCIMB 1366 / Fx l1 / Sio-4) TaxID=880071 RepID=I4AF28_BERLS|nr:hypothetical protein [Bernardetia litoralis]AFM02563.1 hypothetical protein Fleli_0052 [Bernardetia litoralis DSM 6794]